MSCGPDSLGVSIKPSTASGSTLPCLGVSNPIDLLDRRPFSEEKSIKLEK